MTQLPHYEVFPTDRKRRVTGKRMLGSLTEKPHVTLTSKIDLRSLISTRDAWSPEIEKETGLRLTLTSLLLKLASLSLRQYPRINGRVEEGEIRLYRTVNLGVAVALDEGLLVPVIRNVDEKSLRSICLELNELTEQARLGNLSQQAMMEGTFTLSNLGAFNVDHFTPIINSPEIAILGVGRSFPEVQMENDRPIEVSMMNLSLSFDHAAIDGAQAAKFLQIAVQNIEKSETVLGTPYDDTAS